MKHPDVTAYARRLPLDPSEQRTIGDHLELCGECRDLVLFIKKVNATLTIEGRVARIAKILDMNLKELQHHIDKGTPIGQLIPEGILYKTRFDSESSTEGKNKVKAKSSDVTQAVKHEAPVQKLRNLELKK